MLQVGVDRRVGVAGPQLGKGVTLPGLGLAAVLDEAARTEPVLQAAEGAAGVDLRELARITHEHDLGPCRFGTGEQPGQLAGADHGGLIHHDDGSAVEPETVAALEVAEEPVNRCGRDAGVVLELPRRPGRQRAADHPVARGVPGPASGGERERLAGAGHTLDDLDPVPRPADRPDHRLLLHRQRPPGGDSGVDRGRSGDADACGSAVEGGGDDAGFDLEHLGCGPADLVGPSRDHHTIGAADGGGAAVQPDGQDVFGTQEPVDQIQDPVDAASGGEGVADGLDDLTFAERAGPGRETLGAGQPPVEPLGPTAARRRRFDDDGPVEHRGERLGVEAERGGPRPPARHQAIGVDAGVLGLAGGVGGVLGGPGAVLAVLVQVGLDLPAPGRELPQHRPRNAGDVGDAVAYRPPLDTEALGELPAQVGFVEVPDGGQPGVQRPAVQRRPPAVTRGVGEVGDHDMGVQVRVPGPGGAVPKRGGHEPIPVDHGVAALAAAHPARHPLQHPQRPGHGGVGGVADLVGHLRWAEREQQRHRLGRTERHVEARDHRHRPRRRQPVDTAGIHMFEHPAQGLGVDLAGQPQPRGARAHPHPGRLLGARVVLLQPRATVSR